MESGEASKRLVRVAKRLHRNFTGTEEMELISGWVKDIEDTVSLLVKTAVDSNRPVIVVKSKRGGRPMPVAAPPAPKKAVRKKPSK